MAKKASEYYAELIAADNKDKAVVSIALAMLVEVKDIMKERQVRSNTGLFSILDEQDRKWKSFAEQAKELRVRPDGFRGYLKAKMPQQFDAWQNHRGIALL